MNNFTYVSKKEAAPQKKELIKLINAIQDEVREHFTFNFIFIGSSSRNMITCEKNGNVGYDFDVNIEPNDPDEDYSAVEIHNIIFEAIRKHMKQFGYSNIEKSTSVITIRTIDRKNSKRVHSCDLAIVFNCGDGRQQYIKCDKRYGTYCTYSWEYRGSNYNIEDKLDWICSNNLKSELRKHYLNYKNCNNDTEKRSRTIFAEAVNDLCNEKGYRFRR